MTDKKSGLIERLEGLKYAVRDNDYRTGYNRAVNTSINLTKATLAEILGYTDAENKSDIDFLKEVIKKLKTNNLHDRDEGIQMLYSQVSYLSENKIKQIIQRKMGGSGKIECPDCNGVGSFGGNPASVEPDECSRCSGAGEIIGGSGE